MLIFNRTQEDKYLDIIVKMVRESGNDMSCVSLLVQCSPCAKLDKILADIYANDSNPVNRSTAIMGLFCSKGIIKDLSSVNKINNSIELRKKYKCDDIRKRKNMIKKFLEK